MAIDRNNLDESVNPGTDFYQFANGGWIKNNPLPAEFGRYGSFDALAEENNGKVRLLVEELAASESKKGSLYQKVGDFYKTGMGVIRRDELGIQPLQILLDQVDQISNKEGLKNLLIIWQSINIQTLFSFYGIPDKKNSEMVIASLSQGGLGLTDVDYYLSEDDRSISIRNEYINYISRILELSGIPDESAQSKAKEIIKFETRLAKASMTRLERRDPYKVYNKMSTEELVELCPEINWRDLFNKLNLNDLQEINVSQPFFFKEFGKMISEMDISIWKTWLHWTIINNNSEFLSSDFINANFEFYGTFLSGKNKLLPLWKRVLASSNSALGEAIGELYVAKYFPPQAKIKMLTLVNNLKLSLEGRIQNLEWMSDSTKVKALEKLDSMIVKIGYPDKWRNYNLLEIGNSSFFENVKSASLFNYLFNINKIGKPVDKGEWGMSPQTVNAYYNPSGNEIVFPAAILQPPFFFQDGDDAVNYGAIGMVIGHEMTHGFDDQGRNYDKNGNLTNWWSDEDADRFKIQTQLIINQFNQFTILNDVKADGELTLGENIADLGGLNVAFTALRKAWEANPPENSLEGFTPTQRFFLSYAHVWANNITKEEMLRRTKEDVHSLGHLRVNGPLQQMNQFAEAFGVKQGEPMTISEERRANIW